MGPKGRSDLNDSDGQKKFRNEELYFAFARSGELQECKNDDKAHAALGMRNGHANKCILHPLFTYRCMPRRATNVVLAEKSVAAAA